MARLRFTVIREVDGYGGPSPSRRVAVFFGVGRTAIAEPDPVGPGEEPTTSAFGLAGQAGVAWAPSRSFGFGLTRIGNLNELRSFGAVTRSVHVGRVR